MRGSTEFGFFLVLATASHFALFDKTAIGSPSSAGDAGDASITLAASSENLSAMVEKWERPVDAVQEVVFPRQVETPVSQSAPVNIPPPVTPHHTPPAMVISPLADNVLPQVDTAVPPPPQTFAATKSARPLMRPAPPPRKQAAPATKARPATAQRASGTGQRKAAGSNKAAKPPASQQAANPALMAQWGSTIRSAVERRKKYPSRTRARGKVILAVAVSSNGALSSVKVRQSSGHSALDQAAVAAVKRARFKAAPRGLPSGVHHFSLPISFGP